MHQFLIIVHFLALGVAMGASTTGTIMPLVAARMPPDTAMLVMSRVGPVLSRSGAAGLAVLILSGLALVMIAPGMAAAGGGWFKLKLVFALGAVCGVGFIHACEARMRRGADVKTARMRIMWSVRFVLTCAIGAVISAVMAFH